MKELETIQVFSKKLNKYLEVEICPSMSKLDAIQQTGAGTRMLVPDSPDRIPIEPNDVRSIAPKA